MANTLTRSSTLHLLFLGILTSLYTNRPKTLRELINIIRAAIANVAADMLDKVAKTSDFESSKVLTRAEATL